MGDHEARGDDTERKADKKLSGWGLFGSKYEDAADLYDKAANFFKLSKNYGKPNSVIRRQIGWHTLVWLASTLSCVIGKHWGLVTGFRGMGFESRSGFETPPGMGGKKQRQYFGSPMHWRGQRGRYPNSPRVITRGDTGNRAASVYIKIANCHLKGDSKHEAASAYVEAANCYKKFSPQEAAQALDQAVNLFLEIGRLSMAARYCKDIGEIYQQEQDLEKASDYLERAADLFDSEGQTSQSNTIKQKVAEIAAQLEQYPKATEIFEEIARQSINNNLLKYSVRGILLNAGICQLCRADAVAIQNSLERYQEIDPTFSGTREYKLLADLAASMDDGDVAKFTDAIKEFDGMTRLDPWKTTLLLRAKNELKKQEDDEDDLT
ncbi:Alpha-soluble NSF attachment protein [Triticum urartu]|uniref:Alpha-soluble NSF attachment protein n=3 Tax=Triticinae TaxID=1648030 RepID=M7Z6U7_TRIUA|nr:Alpha-soluble NSF attachment protein [Triticum urartu]